MKRLDGSAGTTTIFYVILCVVQVVLGVESSDDLKHLQDAFTYSSNIEAARTHNNSTNRNHYLHLPTESELFPCLLQEAPPSNELQVESSMTPARVRCLQCSQGHYLDAIEGTCYPCELNCLECSSDSLCFLWNYEAENIIDHSDLDETYSEEFDADSDTLVMDHVPSTFLEVRLFKKQHEKSDRSRRILVTCDSSQFQQGSLCVACDPSCKTCSSLATNCSSCFDAKVLTSSNTCESICPAGFYAFGKVCKDSCDSGYYGDNSNRSCVKCTGSCLKCLNANYCFDCGATAYLQDGVCLSNCSNGFYLGLYNTCYACPVSCSKCTSSTSCTECSSGYYLSSTSCVACHKNCSTCTGAGVDHCIACTQSLVKLNGVCTKNAECIDLAGVYYSNGSCSGNSCPSNCDKCSSSTNCLECTSGYYLYKSSSGAVCLRCHDSCLSCSGNLRNECLTCNTSSYFYYVNQCLKECPQGTFATAAGTCSACDSSTYFCSSCSSQTQCTTCVQGYYLQTDSATQISTCQKCHANCKYCTGPLSTQCALCDTGLCNNCTEGLFQDGTSCFALSLTKSCSPTSWIDYSTRICTPCPVNCATCNESRCTSCVDNQYLLTLDGACVACSSSSGIMSSCSRCISSSICTQCKPGYRLIVEQASCQSLCPAVEGYYQKADGSCDACPAGCKACSFNAGCGGCMNGIVCSACKDNYFLNSSTMQCSACQPGCEVCTSNASNCVKCKAGYFLQPSVDGLTTTCVSTCQSGYYNDSASRLCHVCKFNNCLECSDINTCTKCLDGYYFQESDSKCAICSANCLTCSGSSSNCITCTSDRLLYLNISGTKSCVTACDTNQFVNVVTLSCANCSLNCEFCSSENLCQGCQDGFYLIVNSGNVSNSSCSACDSSCKSCSGPNSTQCTSCATGKYLFGNQCLSPTDCVAKGAHFADDVTHRCLNCHPLCSQCTGNTVTKCTKCVDGYFFNSTSTKCELCDSTCKTCIDSATKCLSCLPGNYYNSNACLSTASACPKKTFPDTQNSSCTACSSPCDECSGLTIFECTTCVSGYYFDTIGLAKCVKCMNNCTQCSSAVDSDTNTTVETCTLCANGYTIDSNSNSSTLGKCIACSANMFSVNNVCSSCNAACTTCAGSSTLECKSCPPGQYLVKDTNATVGSCSDCATGCNSCSSKSATDCQSCSAGYYFYANTCYLDICPYGLTADSAQVCQCVISGCASCLVDRVHSKTYCDACQSSSQYIDNGVCKDTCASPKLTNTRTKKCVDACLISEYLSTDLKECSAACFHYKLIDASTGQPLCVNTCPSGYFKEESTRSCTKCHANCASCNGPSKSECSACAANYWFHNAKNLCEVTCIKGYVKAVTNPGDPLVCKVCKEDCSACISSLVLYVNKCLTSCPLGFTQQDGTNRCIVQQHSSLSIISEDAIASSGVSPFVDLRLEAILVNVDPSKILSVQWRLESSTDERLALIFLASAVATTTTTTTTASSPHLITNQLILLISAKYLRGGHRFVLIIDVTLQRDVKLNRRLAVVTRQEMTGGKFAISSFNALDNSCSFQLGYFETLAKTLSYRITCEKLVIESERYLRSKSKLIAFDRIDFNMTDSNGLYLTTSTPYVFPLESTNATYVCTAIVNGTVTPTSSGRARSSDQQDYSVLSDTIVIPAATTASASSNVIAKVKLLLDNADSAGWNSYRIDEITQIVHSLGDALIVKPESYSLAYDSMEAALAIAFPESKSVPSLTQANHVWASPYKHCQSLKLVESSSDNSGSISCECAANFLGLFCQHDARIDTTILMRRMIAGLPAYIVYALDQFEAKGARSSNAMKVVQLVKRLLEFEVKFENDLVVFGRFLKYVAYLSDSLGAASSQFATVPGQAVVFDDVWDDVADVLLRMEVYLSVSARADAGLAERDALVQSIKVAIDSWNALLSQSANLGDIRSVSYGDTGRVTAVTFQPPSDSSYVKVSFDDLVVELPPAITQDWKSLTLVQRRIAFLPQRNKAASVILSSVYEVDVYARESTERVAYSDLLEPIRISIKLHAPLLGTSELLAALECVTYEESSQSWTTRGVKRASFSNADTVVCETSHLSTFAVRKASPSNSFNAGSSILLSQLLSALPLKTKVVASVGVVKYGAKEVSTYELLRSQIKEALSLKTESKTSYYIDSFIEVEAKKIVVLDHFSFPGITPFKYPERFLDPFGLEIVIGITSSMVFWCVLVKFQVASLIIRIITYILERRREMKEDKLKSIEKKTSKAGRKSMPILALAEIEQNLQGKKDRDIELGKDTNSNINGLNSGGDTVKAEAAAAAAKEEEDKDLRYLNKIRKNVHLIYDSVNLDTPKNGNQPGSQGSSPVARMAETESVDFGAEVQSVESNRIHEANLLLEGGSSHPSKRNGAADNQGFSAMAKKAGASKFSRNQQRKSSFASKSSASPSPSQRQTPTSNNNLKRRMNLQTGGDNNTPKRSLWGRQDSNQPGIRRGITNGTIIFRGKAGVDKPVSLWDEEDFQIEENAEDKKKELFSNLKEAEDPKKDKHKSGHARMRNQGQDAPEITIVTIVNPLKHIIWFYHHPLVSLIVKTVLTPSAKYFNVVGFHLSLFAIAACSIISNNLSGGASLFLTAVVAPIFNQACFSIYTVFFFFATANPKYDAIRGRIAAFDQALHLRFIVGMAFISVILFLGYVLLAIEFGQKQYIRESQPTITRFVIGILVDQIIIEGISLILVKLIEKKKEKLPKYFLEIYHLAKGSAVHLTEITHFLIQKSEKKKKSVKKIQDIAFKGDLQNHHRQAIQRKKTVLKINKDDIKSRDAEKKESSD